MNGTRGTPYALEPPGTTCYPGTPWNPLEPPLERSGRSDRASGHVLHVLKRERPASVAYYFPWSPYYPGTMAYYYPYVSIVYKYINNK
jgi:hypothetical protein